MKLFYMFSSKSLIILTLTLRSWIHFELIFAYDIREDSNFTLFHVDFLSTICWKKYTFPIEWSWHPCQKSFDYKWQSLSLGSLLYNVSFLSWLTIILKTQRWCVLLQKRKIKLLFSVIIMNFQWEKVHSLYIYFSIQEFFFRIENFKHI